MSHRVTVPALRKQHYASWWRHVCYPVWHQSTTGGGVPLTFLTSRLRSSDEYCAPPMQYPGPPGWSLSPGKDVIPHLLAVPELERAGRD